MGDKSRIAYCLVNLMDANNTSGKELAEYLDVTPSTISNYRKGTRSIDIDTLSSICEYYAITLDQFLGKETIDEDEMNLLRLWRNADVRGRRIAILALEDAQKSYPVFDKQSA